MWKDRIRFQVDKNATDELEFQIWRGLLVAAQAPLRRECEEKEEEEYYRSYCYDDCHYEGKIIYTRFKRNRGRGGSYLGSQPLAES